MKLLTHFMIQNIMHSNNVKQSQISMQTLWKQFDRVLLQLGLLNIDDYLLIQP